MLRFNYSLLLRLSFAPLIIGLVLPMSIQAKTEEATLTVEEGVEVTVDAAGEGSAACEEGGCGEGCTCENCSASDSATTASATTASATTASAASDSGATSDSADDSSSTGRSAPAIARATHKQVLTIDVNGGDLDDLQLNSFCLSADGHVLAACQAAPSDGDVKGIVRTFNAEGGFVSAWDLPVNPEAINRGADGMIYVAGDGKLLKLDADGEVVLTKPAPHVELLKQDTQQLREQVIRQLEAQNNVDYASQVSMYEGIIKQYEEKPEDERSEEDTQILESLKEARDRFQEMADEQEKEKAALAEGEEAEDQGPSEEEIEAAVDSMTAYKSKVASISQADGHVFIATGEAAGYGYCVWRMDAEFNGEEQIANGLSGCCGQMDVQACKGGVYVAENSRDRVVRFDLDGEKLCEWGHSARSGLRGFGSCCNPMNVAFGPGGTVYTAESGTGRVKRYSPEGELLGLVGKVDLVPGCKKVAISVTADGKRVYMLDITRNTILAMEELSEGEQSEYVEPMDEVAAADGSGDMIMFGAVEVEEDQSDSFLGSILDVFGF